MLSHRGEGRGHMHLMPENWIRCPNHFPDFNLEVFAVFKNIFIIQIILILKYLT